MRKCNSLTAKAYRHWLAGLSFCCSILIAAPLHDASAKSSLSLQDATSLRMPLFDPATGLRWAWWEATSELGSQWRSNGDEQGPDIFQITDVTDDSESGNLRTYNLKDTTINASTQKRFYRSVFDFGN